MNRLIALLLLTSVAQAKPLHKDFRAKNELGYYNCMWQSITQDIWGNTKPIKPGYVCVQEPLYERNPIEPGGASGEKYCQEWVYNSGQCVFYITVTLDCYTIKRHRMCSAAFEYSK